MAEQKARINLASTDIGQLNQICENIIDIAKKTKVKISGPIPLPTKRLKHTTRRSPCGNGKASFENFEMRIHKRMIDLGLTFGTRLDEIADTSSNNHFRNYDPKGKFFYIEGLITESCSTDLRIRKSLLNEIKKQAFFIDGIERVFVGINAELNNQVIVDSLDGIFIQEFEDYYPCNSITCNGLGKIVEFRKVKV